MDKGLSRRHFLFRHSPPLRPPWAVEEEKFLQACTRCNDCITACPENILVERHGRPQVDFFRGECTFCGECVAACQKNALVAPPPDMEQKPWLLTAAIGHGCLAGKGVYCRACGEVCAPRAIGFRMEQGLPKPAIQANLCHGCGACVRVCPVGAVVVQPLRENRHAA